MQIKEEDEEHSSKDGSSKGGSDTSSLKNELSDSGSEDEKP